MKVNIINKSNNSLPEYATLYSSGMDIRAFLENPFVLEKKSRAIIKTGLYLEIPEGFEAQVRSRSGLSIKKGVVVLNSPGTIDSDYRGEVGVILINHSEDDFTISNGDRIAQAELVKKEEYVLWEIMEAPTQKTDRIGGLGSTGVAVFVPDEIKTESVVLNEQVQPEVKRGRGRPRKVA